MFKKLGFFLTLFLVKFQGLALNHEVIDSNMLKKDAVHYWEELKNGIYSTILNPVFNRPEGSLKPLLTIESARDKFNQLSENIQFPISEGPIYLDELIIDHSGYEPKEVIGKWRSVQGDSLVLTLCRWNELSTIYHLDTLMPILEMLFQRQSLAEKRYFNFKGAVIDSKVLERSWVDGYQPVLSQWITLINENALAAWTDSLCQNQIINGTNFFNELAFETPIRIHRYYWEINEKRKLRQQFKMMGFEIGQKTVWMKSNEAISFLGIYYKPLWQRLMLN